MIIIISIITFILLCVLVILWRVHCRLLYVENLVDQLDWRVGVDPSLKSEYDVYITEVRGERHE